MKKNYFNLTKFLIIIGYLFPALINYSFGQTTFNYTGSVQTYVVPPGVFSIQIECWGAQGQGGFGGLGGYVKGELSVSPGQTYYIYVGGQNGYNGGGLGYAAIAVNGGGASDLRFGGTTLNDRIIVAGAGGGGASTDTGPKYGGHGGGGQTGSNYSGGGGGTGYGSNGGPGGSNGGTADVSCHSGGAGGGGVLSGGQGSCNTCYTYSCGLPGSFGQGGNGATWENGICYSSYGGTSGGGGGYFGGGGTSVGNCGSGAGGGGSSWTGTLNNNVLIGGVRSGNGLVVITSNCTASSISTDVANLPNATGECSVTPVTPTATNNCGLVVNGTTTTTFPVTNQGTTVVTWNYNDGNGNTTSQTQNIVITDVTSPVANAATLPNATAQCAVSSLSAPTATDNCNGTITGMTAQIFPITAQGTTVVTWSYNDGNGNISTQTQNVVITDVTAPIANLATLTNITAECSVASITAPTATDNCNGVITGTTTQTFPITAQGTTTVTWTYNDGNGNLSTQTQNVVISDVTAPIANLSTLTDVTSECSVASITAPTATDNCSGTITGTTATVFPITTQGTTTVTWTYNDGNGNINTQTQNVVIDDLTAPIANVASLSDITTECSVSPTTPTATDNCNGVINGTPDVTFPISTQGTTIVTWTYNDGNGNTSTQTQNVIITDITAPLANLATLADVTSECSVSSLTAPNATDNCNGTIMGTTNQTLPITTQGTTVVTWTYNDGNGNLSTQMQNVVITDITAPVSPTLSNLNGDCNLVVIAPTTNDNCAGLITGTTVDPISFNNPGNYTVNWTFDDGNGNFTSLAQTIVISDFNSPMPTIAALANVTGQCSVINLPTAPTAMDNCAGLITGTTNAVFPITSQGTTVIIWTFDDGNGNIATQSQNIVVNDNIAPIANSASLNNLTGTCSVDMPAILPTATDNCAGSINASTTTVFPITTIGNTVITWEFADGNGNIATQTQNVIITGVDVSVTINGATITAVNPNGTYTWMNCSTGNVMVGENSQSFTATENDDYALIINENGCIDTSSCFIINKVGLSESIETMFSVYPNPNAGVFHIETEGIMEVKIYDMAGKIIMTQKLAGGKNTLELFNVESGMYFIQAIDENNNISSKRISIAK